MLMNVLRKREKQRYKYRCITPIITKAVEILVLKIVLLLHHFFHHHHHRN